MIEEAGAGNGTSRLNCSIGNQLFIIYMAILQSLFDNHDQACESSDTRANPYEIISFPFPHNHLLAVPRFDLMKGWVVDLIPRAIPAKFTKLARRHRSSDGAGLSIRTATSSVSLNSSYYEIFRNLPDQMPQSQGIAGPTASGAIVGHKVLSSNCLPEQAEHKAARRNKQTMKPIKSRGKCMIRELTDAQIARMAPPPVMEPTGEKTTKQAKKRLQRGAARESANKFRTLDDVVKGGHFQNAGPALEYRYQTAEKNHAFWAGLRDTAERTGIYKKDDKPAFVQIATAVKALGGEMIGQQGLFDLAKFLDKNLQYKATLVEVFGEGRRDGSLNGKEAVFTALFDGFFIGGHAIAKQLLRRGYLKSFYAKLVQILKKLLDKKMDGVFQDWLRGLLIEIAVRTGKDKDITAPTQNSNRQLNRSVATLPEKRQKHVADAEEMVRP